jgi:excisionase family DNA binding protein
MATLNLPVADRPTRLLYSFDEAGAALMMSGRQVQTLVAQGTIRSVRIGRLVRIAHEDLQEYVASLRADRR